MNNNITLQAIGKIHSPYTETNLPPRQGQLNSNVVFNLEVYQKYLEGVADIKENDLVEIIFYFHKGNRDKLTVYSYGHHEEMGVFSTRSPNRPNPLGITTVKITKIKDNIFSFIGGDMLNDTPVIDIKPHINRINQ